MARKIKEFTLPTERRQVEIINLVLNSGTLLSMKDMCDALGVKKATIERDLQELRAIGIQISSSNKRLNIIGRINPHHVKRLLNNYVSTIGDMIGFPQSIAFLVKKKGTKALLHFNELVKAIEDRRMVKMVYYKFTTNTTEERLIEPYDIIPDHKQFRLIAISKKDDRYKQFLMQNILEMTVLDESFRRKTDYSREAIFKHSFNFWRGNDDAVVEILFTPKVAHIIKSEIFTDDQEIVEDSRGFVTLKMRVNAVEQVAAWVVSFGDAAKVINPKDLREMVIDKAKSILSIYPK
jgi:predicted DNA-binding transcriptional regulator YafY